MSLAHDCEHATGTPCGDTASKVYPKCDACGCETPARYLANVGNAALKREGISRMCPECLLMYADYRAYNR